MGEHVRKDYIPIPSNCLVSQALLSSCQFLHSLADVALLLDAHRIVLNNAVLDKDVSVSPKDVLVLLTPQSKEPVVNTAYTLVYEDDFLLVVDKPANLPIHPAGKYYFNTLVSLLREAGKKVYPVTRLDKDTSGLVVFATSPFHTRLLQDVFASPLTVKTYFAVVFGTPTPLQGVIDAPLLQQAQGVIRDHMVVDMQGKPSQTSYRVIETACDLSLVQVRLHTGRRHQIRAHFAHLGHPLVGDKQYGSRPDLFAAYNSKDQDESLLASIRATFLADRQLLHCAQLSFQHPKTGDSLLFSSNIAKDMLIFLNEHRFTSFPIDSR